MKKLIKVLTIIVPLSCSDIFCQSLTNTTWAISKFANTIIKYARFGNDSMAFSSDNTSFTTGSTYAVNTNSFSIVDLFGPCNSNIGKYAFSIQNDTLKFTLINDACSSRKDVMTNFYWVRLQIPTGLPEKNRESQVNIYPNPSTGKLTIPFDGNKKVIISNMAGQIIKDIGMDSDIFILEGIATGKYVVRVFDDTGKLIVSQQIMFE